MQTESVKATAVQQGMRLATARLIETFKAGKIGDVLTDEQLSERCERQTPPGGNGYANLQSAIRHVEKNYGLIWRRVAGTGCVKCLDSVEVNGLVGSSCRHISKVSRRILVVGAAMQVEDLPESDRSMAMARIAQIGAIEHIARTQTTKKLSTRKATQTPDMAKLLEAFTPGVAQ